MLHLEDLVLLVVLQLLEVDFGIVDDEWNAERLEILTEVVDHGSHVSELFRLLSVNELEHVL